MPLSASYCKLTKSFRSVLLLEYRRYDMLHTPSVSGHALGQSYRNSLGSVKQMSCYFIPLRLERHTANAAGSLSCQMPAPNTSSAQHNWYCQLIRQEASVMPQRRPSGGSPTGATRARQRCNDRTTALGPRPQAAATHSEQRLAIASRLTTAEGQGHRGPRNITARMLGRRPLV